MLIDLNYTRGITTAAFDTGTAIETRVSSWTNYGLAGGSFVQPVDSPYGPAWVAAGGANIAPPLLTPNKGGAGINVPESPAGARSLVASFPTPAALQGSHPHSVEVWLWKNNEAADGRGVFAWTTNAPATGDAGKFCAGNPAGFHNNGKDLAWGTLPSQNAWHHIVLTYDGTTEKIYLDGNLVNSGAKALNIAAETIYPMLFSGILSAAPNGTSTSLNGAIGSVRVHSDALTAADVAANNLEGISAVPVVNVSILAQAATDITGSTATLNGDLQQTSAAASTALTFYYGMTDMGNTTSGWVGTVPLAAPRAVGAFSAPITGLAPDKTYYVRIRGVNANGDGWSAPVTFHTPGAPGIVNLPAILGEPGSVSLSATLNPNGYATGVKLYWGPTDGGTVVANWANAIDLGNQAAGTVTSSLTGLNPAGATYYYTFVANNTAGTVFATPSRSFKTRQVPASGDLLLSAITEVLPDSGAAGIWPTFLPSGQTLVPINAPTVKKFGGVKWVKNLANTSQGFRLQDPTVTGGNYVNSIPVTGASVVVAVRPLPRITDGDPWSSIVDVFYNRLVLGFRNDSGLVQVWRNGTLFTSTTALPAEQTAILSLVVQPTGEFKVWANGAEIMNNLTTSDMTALVPNVPGGYANAINLGRNQPDAWPVFNGHIGDVFLYKTALTDTDRQTLETSLTTKFVTDATQTFAITATPGANGSISDNGTTQVLQGSDKTYTVSASSGYVVSDVLVDGISKGPALSYTFTDVSSAHTISASFVSLPPQTITATASANGTISPDGATAVPAGADQVYLIKPNSGYKVANVLVDGVSMGTMSRYTFKFVVAPHTIQVTFAALTMNIPESGELLFSAVGEDLPADGADAGNWPFYVPSGTFSPLGTPVVQVINGMKWVNNVNAEGDGLLFSLFTAPIPVNGVTAVAVVQPEANASGDNWTSIIDVFYNRLMLGIRNDTGAIQVWCNGVRSEGPVILSGQRTVLAMVVDPSGSYRVFANGIQVMNVTAAAPMTSLDPLWQGGGTGFWSYISVGRNQPDAWTTYNGKIGDLFLYKTALTDVDRTQLEGVLMAKYGIVLHSILSQSGPNGAVTPTGTVKVVAGTSPTFSITPNYGYAITDVLVDGVSAGPLTSYTFTNVAGDHTISASFVSVDIYSDWIAYFYVPTDPQSGKDQDPDQDGKINLIEYAFDDDPTTGAANPKIRSQIVNIAGETALVLTFPALDTESDFTGEVSKSLEVGGVVYTVEGSNGLGVFDQGVSEIAPITDGMVDPFVGWSYRSFRLNGPVGGPSSRGPSGFLRVKVENAGE